MMPQPTEVTIEKLPTDTTAGMSAMIDVQDGTAFITIDRMSIVLTHDEITELLDLLEEVEETLGE